MVERWNGQGSTWDAFGPDLYLGCSGHRQPIPVDRAAKIAIHVNPYGPVQIPGISEPQEAIDWTLAQKPDAVFGYGAEQDRLLWSYWSERHGILWVPMPTAGDKCLFDLEPRDEEKDYDAVYLGGRWAYKGKSIDPYLLPALDRPGLKYKLHGWGEWPSGYCSGPLSDDKVAGFLHSGRVGPCISEPHTQQYGFDIPERVWKVALCGTLPVHDPVPNIKALLPSLVVAQNPQNYSDLCWHYSRPENAAERLDLTVRVRAEVLAGHTYHHRLAGMLSSLGFTADAAQMLA